MKKNKLLSLILVAAMVMSMIVLPVSAADAACPEHADVTEWIEVAEGDWNKGFAMENGKHYKLMGNQNVEVKVSLGTSKTACIDLNGYTIKAVVALRTITNSGTLTILDSGTTGTIEAYAEAHAVSGANIYTEKGVLNIYGGTIKGGKTHELQKTGYAYSDSTYKPGGNIYVDSGTLNLYGGTITDGIARRGGNIFVNNGTFNMYGGTVTKGIADRGGNIYGDARINIYGGTVSDGLGGWGGANLFTYGSANSLHIYGGEIMRGCNKNAGDAVISSVYSNVYIYGGVLDNREGTNVAGQKSTKLVGSSGSATSGIAKTYIYGGTFYGDVSPATTNSDNQYFNGRFVTNESAYLMDCACMEVVGSTYIIWHYDTNCTDCAYTTALEEDAANDLYTITRENGNHTPVASETSSTQYACAYCNAEVSAPTTAKEGPCAHEEHGTVTWLPWDGAATDGHFFVEENMKLNGQVNIRDGNVFCLDLNGKTVTAADGKRMFEVGDENGSEGEFYLMDLAGNGKLVGATSTTASGAVVRTYKKFYFYSGTIVGATVSVNSTSNYYAGSVYVASGTFNMYGGTVTGGKVLNAGTGSGAGGNFYLTGGSTTVISGGVIENGECTTYGANIAVNTGAQVTITGDVTIRGGKASNGESIYVRGEKNNKGSRMEIQAGVVIEAGLTETVDMNITSPGKIVISEGVTFCDAAAVAYVNSEAYGLLEGKYTTYGKLTDALAAAIDTKTTVYMAKDVAVEGDVDVYNKLDLKGKKLTATGKVDVSNSSGSIEDSVGTSTVVAEEVVLGSHNGQLGITTEEGMVFETVQVVQKLEELQDTEGNQFTRIKFFINESSEETKLDDAIRGEVAERDAKKRAVQVKITVTWEKDGVAGKHSYLYTADLVDQYVEGFDRRVFTCDIRGLEDLGTYEIVAEVESNLSVVQAIAG